MSDPGANVSDFRFDLGDGAITIDGKNLDALELDQAEEAILYFGAHSTCSFVWGVQEGKAGIVVSGTGTWPGEKPTERKVFAPFDVE